jgi:multidrug resistance efflux pump
MSRFKPMKEHELEEQQINILLKEDDAPLTDISTSGIGVYLITGIGLFLIFAIFSITINIPQEIQIDFVLKGGSTEEVKRIGETTFIGKVLIKPGANVEKGTPLLSITSPIVTSLINDINQAENSLAFHLKTKTSFHKQEIGIYEGKITFYQKQIEQLNDEMRSVYKTRNNEMVALNKQLALSRKNLKRQESLFEQKVISQSQLEVSQLSYQKQAQSLNATVRSYVLTIQTLQQQIRTAQTNQHEISTSIDKLNQDHNLEEVQLRKSLLSKKQRLALTFGSYNIENDHLILLAEQPGNINMISEPETKINAGEIVWRIEQDPTKKYAFAKANSAEVGKLKIGQKVVLKYESYPSFYYGAMQGIIESIENSSDDSGHFLVRMAVEDDNFKQAVKKGMTGRAAVITEEITLMQLLLKIFASKIES